MYQSLLPEIKPLVYEGKSGVLTVTHKYDDQAQVFIKEGIIEQVETKKLRGKVAAATFIRWVSVTSIFEEGEQYDYVPDPEIDTNGILSFLEKSAKNIELIKKNISDDSAIFKIDSEKLNKSGKLSAEDLKIALLFDGKRNIEQTVLMAGKSELAVLSHVCRLILSGVAKKTILKNEMPQQEKEKFLQLLTEKMINLVGPAGSLLMDDAFEELESEPGRLAWEEISPLLRALGTFLDEKERDELLEWGMSYL